MVKAVNERTPLSEHSCIKQTWRLSPCKTECAFQSCATPQRIQQVRGAKSTQGNLIRTFKLHFQDVHDERKWQCLTVTMEAGYWFLCMATCTIEGSFVFWAKVRWRERREQLRCVGEGTKQNWLGLSCGHLNSLAMKSRKKMAESSEQIRNSDGNPAIQSTKSGINDTISASSPVLRLTGDPEEHESFQEGNGNGLRMSHVVHLLSPGFQEQRPSNPSLL